MVNVLDYVLNYDDATTLLSLPLTFGSTSQTDNFEGTFEANGITVAESGSITTNADGYGTLQLPFETLNNVLRVRHQQT